MNLKEKSSLKVFPLYRSLKICCTRFSAPFYRTLELNDKNSRKPKVLPISFNSTGLKFNKTARKDHETNCSKSLQRRDSNLQNSHGFSHEEMALYRGLWIFTIFENKNILAFPPATRLRNVFGKKLTWELCTLKRGQLNRYTTAFFQSF